MKRWKLQLGLVLLLAALFAGNAQADNTITWGISFPKTGTVSGTIDVGGIITPDACWSVSGTTATIRAWKDGCELFTTTATISNGAWTGTIGGLNSGDTYNVTVEAIVSNGTDTETIVTVPATAAAK